MTRCLTSVPTECSVIAVVGGHLVQEPPVDLAEQHTPRSR